MERIDVINYEEELKRNRAKRMLEDKSTLATSILGATSIASTAVVDSVIMKLLNLGIAGMELYSLKKEWKKQEIEEKFLLRDMLRTTTTYQELDKEYRQYVKDVAELIRYVGLSSSKEVLLYLQALMETGHFAKNNDHKYQLFEHERDLVPELFGAKVLTGRSVCRHMSSFFVDVMKELKYTAANINTTPGSEQPIEDAINGKTKLSHQVVGIVECGRKLVFDPTCGAFAAESKDLDTSNLQFEICQVVIPEKKFFLMMSPYSEYINPNNEQVCTTMNKTKLGRMTYGEVKYLKNKIERVLQGNDYNQRLFYASHEGQRKRIESLYQEIMPYSSKPIERHLVRK